MNHAVSAAKSKSVARPTGASYTSFSSVAGYAGAGTNLGNRLKETDRIERENANFAKRLFQKNSALSKKSLDRDYQQHIRLRKMVSKQPVFSKKQRRSTAGHLMYKEDFKTGNHPVSIHDYMLQQQL